MITAPNFYAKVLAPALIVNRIARGVSFESDVNTHGTVSSCVQYAAPQHQSTIVATDQELSFDTNTTGESSHKGTKMAGRPHDDPTLYL